MAFTHTTYGSYGDEKVTSTTKIGGLPLGYGMELPDGRFFRHAKAGSAAVEVGKLYQGPSGLIAANSIFAGPGAISLQPSTAAAGATTLTVVVAATALPSNTFDDGYLCIASSVGTGIGYTYKVKTCGSAAIAATATITLVPNDKLIAGLETGTTRVRLCKSPWDGVDVHTANSVGLSTFSGVACATAAASCYVWLQRRGVATVFTDATTPIVGGGVVASSTVAGAIAVPPAGSAFVATEKQALTLGQCLSPAGTTTQFSVVDLTIE